MNMGRRLKNWIVPKPEKFEGKIKDLVLPHNEFAKIRQTVLTEKNIADVRRALGLEEEAVAKETTQKIRLRSEVSQDELDKIDKEWMYDDTLMSFIDYLYVKHNIFTYSPRDTQILSKVIPFYRSVRISDPKHKTYTHFVLWFDMQGREFVDENSGRTSKEILALYNSYYENKKDKKGAVEAPTENRIVVRNYANLTSSERDKLADEYSQSGRKLSLYDWLLVYKKVSHTQVGGTYVEEYNNSNYADLSRDICCSFPKWLMMVKKRERDSISKYRLSFRDLADLCEEEWFGELQRETKDETVERYRTPPLTLDRVNERIAQLEADLAALYRESVQQKLSIALKYRNRLLDKERDMVYSGEGNES